MMHFDVNWLAIVLATIASMALGMVWYMVLSKQWVAATGKKTEDLLGGGGSATPFIIAAICQLIMAYFIAVLTPVLSGGVVNAYSGAMVGAQLWFGFILMAMIINHRYQNMSWHLTLIDGGYMLGVAVLQGIVIGLFAGGGAGV